MEPGLAGLMRDPVLAPRVDHDEEDGIAGRLVFLSWGLRVSYFRMRQI